MKLYIIGAVVFAGALAACGGGSSSTPVAPGTPVPTGTPVVVSAHLSWTGVAHSSSTSSSSAARFPLDIASPEPIEIGVANANVHSVPASNGSTVATLLVTFTDQNGSAVTPPTGAPTVTVANGALASSVAQPTPSASPTAGPIGVAQINAGSSLGSTTATVTYPNGATSSIGVRVYADPALECPAGAHFGTVEGIAITGGVFSAAPSASADLYLSGPACSDKSTASTTLHAPLGFQSYAKSVPVASITTALPFAASGTTLAISSIVASFATTNGVLVVKGTSGDYGKFRVASVQCGGDQTLCDQNGIVGTVAAYGAGGMFSL